MVMLMEFMHTTVVDLTHTMIRNPNTNHIIVTCVIILLPLLLRYLLYFNFEGCTRHCFEAGSY